MKKKILLVILLSLFLFSGCDKKIYAEKANVKNDKIIINENDITNKIKYINYEYDGVEISLIAVRDSKGKVMVVINTCESCKGSINAYFIQKNDKLQCQNCGAIFLIDNLDKLKKDGCNPIKINSLKRSKGKIYIDTKELIKYKKFFKNWNGPKIKK